MSWIAFFSALLVSGVYAYRHRYTSKRRIFKLYIVQFYYLFFLAPLMAVALFSMMYDIISRPQEVNVLIPIPPVIVLAFNIFSIVMTIIGTAIHSTSTTIYEMLWPDRSSEVYETNELFHGPLSHNMVYCGAILGGFSYVLAEIYHPSPLPTNVTLMLTFGVIVGICQAIGTIWSTYIKPSLVVAFFAGLLTVILMHTATGDFTNYPFATFVYSYLITLTIVLGIYTLLLITSAKAIERYIHHILPQGHPKKR